MIETRLGRARIACSDRHGGVSAPPFDSLNLALHVGDAAACVAENRRRLARGLGLPPPEAWVWLRQVHGTRVLDVGAPLGGSPPEADGAVTGVRGLPLVILSADCVPVVLAGGDMIGVAHAGWAGLLAGVVEEVVARMRAHTDAALEAFVGPCIRPARYEFGASDLERVVARYGSSVASTTDRGTLALDLPDAVGVALARAGVSAVADCGVCTASSPELFSHRRDGPTGRQATIVVLE